MKRHSEPVNDDDVAWQQSTITPPPVVQLTLTLGVIAETGHCQAQVEARSMSDGELLAMQSWPHFPIEDTEERMRSIGRVFTRLVRDHTSPF